jgi:hypothetical protein
MLETERQFRRIIGYRDLAKPAVAIERDLARTTAPSPTEELLSCHRPTVTPGTAVTKFGRSLADAGQVREATWDGRRHDGTRSAIRRPI